MKKYYVLSQLNGSSLSPIVLFGTDNLEAANLRRDSENLNYAAEHKEWTAYVVEAKE